MNFIAKNFFIPGTLYCQKTDPNLHLFKITKIIYNNFACYNRLVLNQMLGENVINGLGIMKFEETTHFSESF